MQPPWNWKITYTGELWLGKVQCVCVCVCVCDYACAATLISLLKRNNQPTSCPYDFSHRQIASSGSTLHHSMFQMVSSPHSLLQSHNYWVLHLTSFCSLLHDQKKTEVMKTNTSDFHRHLQCSPAGFTHMCYQHSKPSHLQLLCHSKQSSHLFHWKGYQRSTTYNSTGNKTQQQLHKAKIFIFTPAVAWQTHSHQHHQWSPGLHSLFHSQPDCPIVVHCCCYACSSHLYRQSNHQDKLSKTETKLFVKPVQTLVCVQYKHTERILFHRKFNCICQTSQQNKTIIFLQTDDQIAIYIFWSKTK